MPGARWTAARGRSTLPLREIVTPPGGALIASTAWATCCVPTTVAQLASDADRLPEREHAARPAHAVARAGRDGLIAAGPPGAILRGDADAARMAGAALERLEEERAFPWMLADRRQIAGGGRSARRDARIARGGAEWQAALALPGEWRDFPFWQGAVRASPARAGGRQGRRRGAQRRRRTQLRAVDTGTKRISMAACRRGIACCSSWARTARCCAPPDSALTWPTSIPATTAELRRMVRDRRTGALHRLRRARCDRAFDRPGPARGEVASGTRRRVAQGDLRAGHGEPADRRRPGHAAAFARWRRQLRAARDPPQPAISPASRPIPRSGDLVLVGDRIVRLVPQSAR